MEGNRSETIVTGIIFPAALFRVLALFLCIGLCLSGAGIRAAAAGPAETPEETGEMREMQETAAEAAQETADTVLIRVEGQLGETDREALLDRINAIRREACEEGIDNPVNGIALTPADYVPLQWSFDLEKIAVIRAAESTILQDHRRPDGSECFTAAPEGVSYTMETLAWGFGSAAEAVEGWYSEKSSYVEADANPAGHYMALINPENRFVGIAELKAQWQRNACAGAFGAYAAAGEGGESEINRDGESVWMIPLRKDLLPDVIARAVEVTAGRIYRAGQRLAR